MGSSGAATHPPQHFFLVSAVLLFFSPAPVLSGPVSISAITPNFTASYFSFIDNSGAFLASQNNSFQARMTRVKPDSESFYFVVIHVSSNTVIWSANRNAPVSQSSELRLSTNGLDLYDDTAQPPVWSTPGNISAVSSMLLLESGNIVLVDPANRSLWESFDYPTDIIVPGQNLTVGKSLVSSSSDEDLSEGMYRLVLSENDAMLQWNGMNYWKMSMDTRAFQDTSFGIVEYMMMNFSGIYLMGKNGDQHDSIIISIILHDSRDSSDDSGNFRVMKLDHNGVFNDVKISAKDGSSVQEFKSPSDTCRIPYICGSLGVCTNNGYCQCAPSFHLDPGMNNGDCVPSDGSLAMPGPCNGSLLSNDGAIKYLSLSEDLDYFLNDFVDPVMINVNLSACQGSCSMNCSCNAVFYSQNSGSCYLVKDYLGTLVIKSSSSDANHTRGYVKVIKRKGDSLDKKTHGFPVLAVVLPLVALAVVIIVASSIWMMRRRRRKMRWVKSSVSKLGRGYSSSSSGEGDESFDSIPGLPVRLDYHELVLATDNFATQIGSGGFGTVYKGTLPDGTDIAVKKITCLGSQGKREFLTEIGVIGKIHHVNLVRLKGFCAQLGERLLVYEFMNRGSLDRVLFDSDPVLEWTGRYEIALGTARGLAYLHTGCDRKIIHCDVKPENILLNDKSHVKISDFGLSKLLSPEESGLFTTMRGTRGYLAPEWLTSAAISDKTDVYSYGMMLLEIIRGKKNSSLQPQRSNISETDNAPGNSRSTSLGESNRSVYFPLLALEMHEEKRYVELVDPRLTGRVRVEDVEKLIRIALCCVQEEPRLRPSMVNVVGMLEGGIAVGEPDMAGLNFLRFYGRRFEETATNEKNDVIFYAQPGITFSSSYDSLSYISEQISGPR